MKLPPAVVVHGLAQARAALAPGRPVTLLSARGAALYAGVGWWRALVAQAAEDQAPPPDILDCADAPGRALEALRHGQRILVLRAPALFADIAERAASLGALVLPEAPVALDLGRPGAGRELQAWLSAGPEAASNQCPGRSVAVPQPQRQAPMSATQIHLAAVFETRSHADAARAALIAAGIAPESILVLDRGDPASRPAPASLWGRLKSRLLPDRHAHHYAEAITRGHPMVLADLDEAQRDAAMAALQAHHPIDLQARIDGWQAEGWSGTFEGQDAWSPLDEPVPAGSDGLVGGDLIAGDYGAVGAPVGGTHVDTDISRGRIRIYRPG